ncbi:hypothetical protein ANO14919_015410 [Xylariales sp. No.14919]|nr:hypothetical protein ANO14919_015410 [Xylariales sp. No.14919]
MHMYAGGLVPSEGFQEVESWAVSIACSIRFLATTANEDENLVINESPHGTSISSKMGLIQGLYFSYVTFPFTFVSRMTSIIKINPALMSPSNELTVTAATLTLGLPLMKVGTLKFQEVRDVLKGQFRDATMLRTGRPI